MERGIFFEPGEGMQLSARGSLMVFKAVSDTTGGAFSLMERELPVSNRRPQPHTHQGPEGFYVLEGSIEFIVGSESRIGGPGFWALVPSGSLTPLAMPVKRLRDFSSFMHLRQKDILSRFKIY